MSSAFPSDSTTGGDRFDDTSLRAAIENPIRMLGFWSAIVLPFVLLTLLALGIAQQSPTVLSGLVTANVTGLVLGKEYKR